MNTMTKRLGRGLTVSAVSMMAACFGGPNEPVDRLTQAWKGSSSSVLHPVSLDGEIHWLNYDPGKPLELDVGPKTPPDAVTYTTTCDDCTPAPKGQDTTKTVTGTEVDDLFSLETTHVYFDVPEEGNQSAEALKVSFTLDYATLPTTSGPFPITSSQASFDEVAVRLIAPDGTTWRVSEAVQHRFEDGSYDRAPVPLSMLVGGQKCKSHEQLELVRPRLDGRGIPLATGGDLVVDAMACTTPTSQLCQGLWHFERCTTADRTAFKAANPDVRFTEQVMTVSFEEIRTQTAGRWTLAFEDTRAVVHDMRDSSMVHIAEVTASLAGATTTQPLLASRFAVASASLQLAGPEVAFDANPIGRTTFRNELALETSKPFVGANELVASGRRICSLGVDYAVSCDIASSSKLEAHLVFPDETTVLVDPAVDQTTRNSSSIVPPSGWLQQPVNGTWRLRLFERTSSNAAIDVTKACTIDWALQIEGRPTDVAARVSFAEPVILTEGAPMTVSIDLTCANRGAEDLYLSVDADNLLSMRHALTLESPLGRTYAPCAPSEDPRTARCITIGPDGKSVRVPTVPGEKMQGIWELGWQVEVVPNLIEELSGGGIEVSNSCEKSNPFEDICVHVRPGSDEHLLCEGLAPSPTMGGMPGSNATRVTGVALVLGERALTQTMAEHRYLDEAEGLSDLDRVALDQHFYDALADVRDALGGSTARWHDLANGLFDIIAKLDAPSYFGTRAGMTAGAGIGRMFGVFGPAVIAQGDFAWIETVGLLSAGMAPHALIDLILGERVLGGFMHDRLAERMPDASFGMAPFANGPMDRQALYAQSLGGTPMMWQPHAPYDPNAIDSPEEDDASIHGYDVGLHVIHQSGGVVMDQVIQSTDPESGYAIYSLHIDSVTDTWGGYYIYGGDANIWVGQRQEVEGGGSVFFLVRCDDDAEPACEEMTFKVPEGGQRADMYCQPDDVGGDPNAVACWELPEGVVIGHDENDDVILVDCQATPEHADCASYTPPGEGDPSSTDPEDNPGCDHIWTESCMSPEDREALQEALSLLDYYARRGQTGESATSCWGDLAPTIYTGGAEPSCPTFTATEPVLPLVSCLHPLVQCACTSGTTCSADVQACF